MSTLPDGKVCVKCQTWEPYADFHRSRSRPDGHPVWCKVCTNASQEQGRRARGKRPKPRTIPGTPGRLCTRCGQWKVASEFGKTKQNASGLRAECKACRRTREQAQRDPVRERQRRRARADKTRAYHQRWYQRHAERLKQKRRSVYAANRDRERTRHAHWRRQHPAKVAEYANRRRRRLAASATHYTDQEWRDLCKRYGNRCLACGSDGPLTADHVVPVSKGGSDGIENIQCLCLPCNQRKGTRIIDYRR